MAWQLYSTEHRMKSTSENSVNQSHAFCCAHWSHSVLRTSTQSVYLPNNIWRSVTVCYNVRHFLLLSIFLFYFMLLVVLAVLIIMMKLDDKGTVTFLLHWGLLCDMNLIQTWLRHFASVCQAVLNNGTDNNSCSRWSRSASTWNMGHTLGVIVGVTSSFGDGIANHLEQWHFSHIPYHKRY
jgi:hypothetical protein